MTDITAWPQQEITLDQQVAQTCGRSGTRSNAVYGDSSTS